LAFSVFFRILFDVRYASSITGGPIAGGPRAGGQRDSVPAAGGRGAEPDWAEAERTAAPPAALPPSPDTGALVLLSLLQAEGRFVDFVQQDIAAFSDGDVGAVARVVHSGCRKVLSAHLRIAAIRGESEGQLVALEPGFDPSRIKLTGNVAGTGRLSGVLRHRGWQATEVHLPTVIDRAGTQVLAPAEVEL
jgi:hypothetical protein